MRLILLTFLCLLNFFCCSRPISLGGIYELKYQLPIIFKDINLSISIQKKIRNEKYDIRIGPKFQNYSGIDYDPIHPPYNENVKSYSLLTTIKRNKIDENRFLFQMENDIEISYNHIKTSNDKIKSINSILSIEACYGPTLSFIVHNNLTLRMSVKIGLGYGLAISSQYPYSEFKEGFFFNIPNYVSLSFNL